ncbi:hypothetical protein I3843_05G143000 [Carya illinoinensis]|nr:hypothetical protein I3843_05G143000 [Carya illinoinensis]
MLAVFISSFFRCPSSFSVSLNHTQTKLDLLCSCPDLMNPSRGLSRGDAFDGGENEVPLTDEETREARYRIGTGWHRLGVEAVNMEFWPVEHPMEPPDEDRPVKCPMPHSSPLNSCARERKLIQIEEVHFGKRRLYLNPSDTCMYKSLSGVKDHN